MYTTPGVYFEQVDLGRPAIGPLRTDIAGFIGYAERGPLLAALKLTGWRQFLATFGQPLGAGHLADAVQGFFLNGGAACYVVRIASRAAVDGAQPAQVALVDRATAALAPADQVAALRLWASHGLLFDPVSQAPRVENGKPVFVDSPGAWGNRLAVTLYEDSLGVTATDAGQVQPADGGSSLVYSLSGFERRAVVRLSQEGMVGDLFRRVAAIEPGRRALVWDQPLTGAGLDLTRSVRIESIEFTLQMLLDGQVAEQHRQLSLAPEHSRYLVDVLRAASRLADGAVELTEADLVQPERWPATVDRRPFVGGRDGLAAVTKQDFLDGLAELARVDEVSLLAAPDLVLQVAPAQAVFSAPAPPSCHDLEPPRGVLHGQVWVAGVDAETPLAGVTVQALGVSGAATTTAADGTFTLASLPVGLVTVRLDRAGYHGLETTAETRSAAPVEPATFFMTAVTLPPTLGLDDVYDVQAAMVRQGMDGFYRVALLDPPWSMLGMEEIRTWRARFDSAFGALYYPWLLLAEVARPGVRAVPPSGHVAGLIARTDLTFGVHQAPANHGLEGVKALTHAVDDVRQGILNPQGINCLRTLPGRGIRVYGARTLSSDAEWRYLNVRRLVLMIEEAIEEANQWAVFEPNNPILRRSLAHSLASFLHALWRRGALAGDTPNAAFQVKCDDENNPPAIVDAGQVVADIAVAPTIPFEFIHFRLGRTVEAVEVTE